MEQEILQAVLERGSWEELIYFIVAKEKLDPWNIDLVKLTSSFINFLKKAKELDFRIPARVVFVAALLLRLKVKYLEIFEEKKEEKKEEKIEIEVGEIELKLPIKRLPKAQVTLEELIKALRKALEVEKRKRLRRKIVRRAFAQEIIVGEDITQRMMKLLEEIKEVMKKLGMSKIEFKQIVEEWKREVIVDHFLPLLHLEHQRKVDLEQPEIFREIWIKLCK